MKEDTPTRTYKTKDGREVTLRAPRWSDLDNLLNFVNSLVEEGVEIGCNKKITRAYEAEYLAKSLIELGKDKKIAIVAEVGSKFAGQLEVQFPSGAARHVGSLVISLKQNYRGLGIGTEMMKEAEVQSRRLGLKLITLEVFATNQGAIRLYKRLGYDIVGKIPKGFLKDNQYIDKIIMVKDLYENARK